jgi:prolyl-tRNA synthetase
VKGADSKKISDYAKNIEGELKKEGLRVKVDDGPAHPGEKYFFWELRGVPIRIEVGPRDLKANQIVVVRRDSGEKKTLKVSELLKIRELLEDIQANIRERAQRKFDASQYTAETTVSLEEKLKEGIAVVGWCGGKECAPDIEGKGTILTVLDENGDCIVCGKKGRKIRVARTY